MRKILAIVVGIFLFCQAQAATYFYPISSDGVVLAFGDSLTYGLGAPKADSYPAVLSRLIGRKIINAGVPGETSQESLKRLPAALNQYHPELVILCLGGNDILQKVPLNTIESNLKKMILLIQQQGAQVFVIAVPKYGLSLSVPSFYKALSEQTGVFIDTTTLPDLLGNRRYKSDTVHFNKQGYKMMAQSIARQLKEYGAL